MPIINDRVQQARAKNALEPEWEAKFEARSYGFRPGRGCHDAIETIFNVAAKPLSKKLWVLDADLAGAFDRINHTRLLEALGSFPARKQVNGWLKAGVMERGTYSRTEEGTPQGGVISPLLMNVALHGMGEAIGANAPRGSTAARAPQSSVLVRYADDFVVMCETEERAWEIKHELATWLEPRGLAFNEDKTRVVHLSQGFDFLGFNIRRFGTKLIIKPSKDAVQRHKEKLREIVRGSRGLSAETLIGRLSPVARGWAAFYRSVVSKKTIGDLDNYMFTILRRWAIRQHRNKWWGWVARRYWGEHGKGRRDKWVFGSNGRHLGKYSWMPIVRHIAVKGDASKDDAELADYWANRSRKRLREVESKTIISLAARQKGLCPGCGLDLVEGAGYDPDDVSDWAKWFTAKARALNVHHVVYRRDGGTNERNNLEVRHTACHQQLHAADYRRADQVTPWPA